MENLTNQQLREYLKNNGVNGTSRMNKQELINNVNYIHSLLYLNKSNPILKGGDYLGDLKGLIKNFDKKIKPIIDKSKNEKDLIITEMKVKHDLREKVKRSPKKDMYIKNFDDSIGHMVGKKKKELVKKAK